MLRGANVASASRPVSQALAALGLAILTLEHTADLVTLTLGQGQGRIQLLTISILPTVSAARLSGTLVRVVQACCSILVLDLVDDHHLLVLGQLRLLGFVWLLVAWRCRAILKRPSCLCHASSELSEVRLHALLEPLDARLLRLTLLSCATLAVFRRLTALVRLGPQELDALQVSLGRSGFCSLVGLGQSLVRRQHRQKHGARRHGAEELSP